MKKKDVVPNKDADFDNFQSNIIGLCTTNQVAWGIVLAALNILTPYQTTWVAAYLLCKNKKSVTSAQRTAKNDAKKALIAKLRTFIQTQVQYNSTMTNSQKLSCGVTPKTGKKSPVPVPDSRPIMDAQGGVGSQVLVRFRQELGLDGTSQRGKPDGVAFCKIVYIVGNTAPASPAVCTNVLFASKSPEKISFDTTQSGQKMYGYACWVNSHLQQGGWSVMFSCTIP